MNASIPAPPPPEPVGPRCDCCHQPTSDSVLGGLCALCLLRLALPSQHRVGEYELDQELARGGSGVVYLARRVGSSKLVALKLAREDVLDRAGVRALFREEAEAGGALDYPYIGRVIGSGVHEGLPFLVLPLMEGGTLEDPHNRSRFERPGAALELISKIASAVEFAHSRGILHCDLKAANILFDADGEPKVCDFGLARPTDGTRTHIGGGTWGWMSPEQVRREALTTASDVFALGVLLHWLLERKLPFGNGADFEARVQQEDPKPPGPWRPEVEWSLHAVCQRALHRDPKARYGTALELVKDLERLRTHRPLQAGRTPLVGSLWYWAQRHAAVPYVIAGLLTVMTVVTLLTAQRQKAELRRVVLDMNAYAAGGQAARVLYRLRENATRIEQAARDPGIKAIAINSSRASGATPADDQSCAEESALASPEALRPYSEGFDTMFVMSRWGCARARLPVEPNNLEYVHRHFEWQHYFRGVEQAMLRGEVPSWVRSAYRSSITQHTKDAISAPIFQGDRWLGVVSGSMTSASAFNRPYAKLESDERMTVLLGALERAPSGSGPAVSNFAYLVHPRLRFGDKLTLDREHAARLERTFGSDSKRQFELANISPLSSADYVDPLLGGRWLAAFAPVGHTGDFVLVQTLDAAATRPANVIVRIGYGLGAASCAALVAVAIFATWTRRRKRSLAAAA